MPSEPQPSWEEDMLRNMFDLYLAKVPSASGDVTLQELLMEIAKVEGTEGIVASLRDIPHQEGGGLSGCAAFINLICLMKESLEKLNTDRSAGPGHGSEMIYADVKEAKGNIDHVRLRAPWMIQDMEMAIKAVTKMPEDTAETLLTKLMRDPAKDIRKLLVDDNDEDLCYLLQTMSMGSPQ